MRSAARSSSVPPKRSPRSSTCCRRSLASTASSPNRRLAMASRAPFLKSRYSGYLHRQVPEEDTELTHVGPDTPCGEYMRRFWQPVCYSAELRDLPLRVKILAAELV